MNTNDGVVLTLDYDSSVDVSVRRYQSLRNGRDEKGADITFGAVRHELDAGHVADLIDELAAAFPDEVEAALVERGVTKALIEELVQQEVAA